MKLAVCIKGRVHFYRSFELKNHERPVEPVEKEWTEGDVEKAPVGQISQPLEIPALSNHSGRYSMYVSRESLRAQVCACVCERGDATDCLIRLSHVIVEQL